MSAGDMLSVEEVLRKAAAQLAEEGIDGSQREARILLAHAMDREPGELIALGGEGVDADAVARFHSFMDARLSGRPVHRIIGVREFYGRLFTLNDACLEPRPETELLVERVLADFRADDSVRFCDVGTGSGVIAVSLLCEMGRSFAFATDISGEALSAAQANASAHGVADRLTCQRCDTLEKVEITFDFIVSNPPYIPTGDIAGLAREVREHDPGAALDGGVDGLVMYRKLLEQAPAQLKPVGRLYLETGHGQHEAIAAIADRLGWGIVARQLDLSGLERIVVLERQTNQRKATTPD